MIERRNYGAGTSLVQSFPWGLFHGGRVMCSDGAVRSLKRIAETADTFFSIPAAVTVKGRTVAGYVTFETADGSSVATPDDPMVAKFIAYTYGKNGALLPHGAWRRPGVADELASVRAFVNAEWHGLYLTRFEGSDADGVRRYRSTLHSVDGRVIWTLAAVDGTLTDATLR
jgi:hypothetical protein